MDGESSLVGGTDGKYTVVARRYRPKSFTELVGQETVAQALSTAIRTCRVGHAYLFTGARGVGKTSTARIFAKALNAPGGPNPDPELDSDVAQAIDSGEDMDVIEIDGASNRGIEEIRTLRANVNVRPSRSRYKIYIIDEVHMLTPPAFNALLKTLEEPPEHVKFIFCTTDPEKIPITVLSRCQRFDFSPVKPDKILERLKFICKSEHADAEEEALRVIARRAAGSMRDSQSLLEQILSFSAGHITTQQVHDVLGTADETLLADTVRLLIERDGAGALRKLDESIADGVDAGQFGEQLLGFLRDLMVVSVGGGNDLLATANPSSMVELAELGKAWGVSTLLSALQLLDEALVKMRHSIQSRILLEVALIQICQLQDLQKLSDLIAQLQGNPGVATAKPAPVAMPPATRPAPAQEPSKAVDEKKKDESVKVSEVSQPATTSEVSATPSVVKLIPPRVDPTIVNSTIATAPNPSASSSIQDSSKSASSSSPSSTQPIAAAQSSINPTPITPSPQEPLRNSNTDSAIQESAGNAADPETSPPADEVIPVIPAEIWDRAIEKMDGFIGDYARMALRLETHDPKQWRLIFPAGSELALEFLESADNRKQMADALQAVVKKPVSLSLVHSQEAPQAVVQRALAPKAPSANQRMRDAAEHPFIQMVCKEFGGEILRVDPPPVQSSVVPPPNRRTVDAVASGSK